MKERLFPKHICTKIAIRNQSLNPCPQCGDFPKLHLFPCEKQVALVCECSSMQLDETILEDDIKDLVCNWNQHFVLSYIENKCMKKHKFHFDDYFVIRNRDDAIVHVVGSMEEALGLIKGYNEENSDEKYSIFRLTERHYLSYLDSVYSFINDPLIIPIKEKEWK